VIPGARLRRFIRERQRRRNASQNQPIVDNYALGVRRLGRSRVSIPRAVWVETQVARLRALSGDKRCRVQRLALRTRDHCYRSRRARLPDGYGGARRPQSRVDVESRARTRVPSRPGSTPPRSGFGGSNGHVVCLNQPDRPLACEFSRGRRPTPELRVLTARLNGAAT
jgi:hypothetical protein